MLSVNLLLTAGDVKSSFGAEGRAFRAGFIVKQ